MRSRTPHTVNADAGPPSEADLGVEPHNTSERTPALVGSEGPGSSQSIAAQSGTAGDEGGVARGAATSEDARDEPESFDARTSGSPGTGRQGIACGPSAPLPWTPVMTTAQAALAGKPASSGACRPQRAGTVVERAVGRGRRGWPHRPALTVAAFRSA